MATLDLSNSARQVNPKPLDYYRGPWVSTAAAKAAVPLGVRHDGMTVKITGDGEYWWLAGNLTDIGLIKKTGGAFIPLAGTDTGVPVTGNVEFSSLVGINAKNSLTPTSLNSIILNDGVGALDFNSTDGTSIANIKLLADDLTGVSINTTSIVPINLTTVDGDINMISSSLGSINMYTSIVSGIYLDSGSIGLSSSVISFGKPVLNQFSFVGTRTSLLRANTRLLNLNASYFNTAILNDGAGVGIQVEERIDVAGTVQSTGFFKTTADRNGWDLKSPNKTGIISIKTPVNSYTANLPNKAVSANETFAMLSDLTGFSSGSVTSVGLSTPSIFTATGSPVTTSGTLGFTLNSQTQNTVFAAPVSGVGVPTFRLLIQGDIPLASTRIAFGSATNVITESIDLTWNNTTKRIGIGSIVNNQYGLDSINPNGNSIIYNEAKGSGLRYAGYEAVVPSTSTSCAYFLLQSGFNILQAQAYGSGTTATSIGIPLAENAILFTTNDRTLIINASGTAATGTIVFGVGNTAASGQVVSISNVGLTVINNYPIRFNNPTNTFYTSLKSGANTANLNLTLPIVDGTSNQVLATNGAGVLSFITVSAGGGGTITSVSGTTNRITSTGGNTPVIDIASTYVGQTSLTTLGTITTGAWNGTALGDAYISSATTWNAKLSNITGLISQGTNVTITGSGTSISPYVINSLGGGGGTTSPAGSDGQVQFNNAGAFGASVNLTWNNTTNKLGVIELQHPTTNTPFLKLTNVVGTVVAGIEIQNATISNQPTITVNSSSANHAIRIAGKGSSGVRLNANGVDVMQIDSLAIQINTNTNTIGNISFRDGKSVILHSDDDLFTIGLKAAVVNSDYIISLPADPPTTNTALSFNGTNYVWAVSGGGIIDITYSNLVAAIGGNTLAKGTYYRITDYQTIHNIPTSSPNVVNTGSTEPLIVLALSNNKISEKAYSETYPQDEISYTTTNTFIAGATKGCILHRKDMIKNISCYYDWRAVKFRDYGGSSGNWQAGGVTINGYLFSSGAINDRLTFFDSPNPSAAYNIEIGLLSTNNRLNNIMFYVDLSSSYSAYTLNNIKIDDGCQNIRFVKNTPYFFNYSGWTINKNCFSIFVNSSNSGTTGSVEIGHSSNNCYFSGVSFSEFKQIENSRVEGNRHIGDIVVDCNINGDNNTFIGKCKNINMMPLASMTIYSNVFVNTGNLTFVNPSMSAEVYNCYFDLKLDSVKSISFNGFNLRGCSLSCINTGTVSYTVTSHYTDKNFNTLDSSNNLWAANVNVSGVPQTMTKLI